MNLQKAMILSGVFALSDVGAFEGLEPNTVEKNISWAVQHGVTSPAESVALFSSRVVESNDVLKYFVAEAEAWYTVLMNITDVEFREKWPSVEDVWLSAHQLLICNSLA